MDFLERVYIDEADEEPLRQIKDKNEIWNFIYPINLSVQRRDCNDQDIYIQVSCKCAWEQEHVLQLVFRQGEKLTRISQEPPRLPKVEALLDLARAHIPRKELGHLMMNDPSVYNYIAAYEAVLDHGVSALFEIVGGLPRMNGFDIRENLVLAHIDAGESVTHRWLSVLASCIEIFRDPYGDDAFGWPPYLHRIKALLVDSYAMAAAGISKPLELLP